MKRIIRVIKNNYKFILGIIVGLMISISSVYAIEAYIESNKVSYDNKHTEKDNVQDSIDELYERSGIHKEKWIDPILNGADPVLQDPLIPVEIKNDGTVYYANENSEWYNYSEKRWANAVILIDNPSNQNYKVGDHILEDDIESYFVWIPRFKYKIWNLGEYTESISANKLTNADFDTSPTNIVGNAKKINIEFENSNKAKSGWKNGAIDESDLKAKFNAEEDAWLTHPAFTLGSKELNGFWIGKFETAYKNATSAKEAAQNIVDSSKIIIKPNSYSWAAITVKNIFLTAYNYKNSDNKHNETIDPHMLKNTEWGAVAYLSHSAYGIGNELNTNNSAPYRTGYSAAPGTDQSNYPGTYGNSDDITQPWNTSVGYLASTTGNITGVYDMSGGALEYMAAYVDSYPGESGFSTTELAEYNIYFNKYNKLSNSDQSYNYRILGDATGEMGPFYTYKDVDSVNRIHNSWYGDGSHFARNTLGSTGFSMSWFTRGGMASTGLFNSQFAFLRDTGRSTGNIGFRIALAPTQ